MRMTIAVPGFKSSRFKPSTSACVIPRPSPSTIAGLPSGPVVAMVRYMCGFTQSNFATVPLRTISCVVSNMAWLWWANAGAQSSAVAARSGAAAVRRFMWAPRSGSEKRMIETSPETEHSYPRYPPRSYHFGKVIFATFHNVHEPR